MPPKSSESNKKKQNTSITRDNFTKDSIIETTYEKVLSIINRVKDFIKKSNSKDSIKLIEDLEWVIKVIANKSLYSYEIKKPKLSRQNSDFNKFVKFVSQYNE